MCIAARESPAEAAATTTGDEKHQQEVVKRKQKIEQNAKNVGNERMGERESQIIIVYCVLHFHFQ